MTSDARKRAAENAAPPVTGTADREALLSQPWNAEGRWPRATEWRDWFLANDRDEQARIAGDVITKAQEAFDAAITAGFRRPVTAGLSDAAEAVLRRLESRHRRTYDKRCVECAMRDVPEAGCPTWQIAQELRAALAAAAPEGGDER